MKIARNTSQQNCSHTVAATEYNWTNSLPCKVKKTPSLTKLVTDVSKGIGCKGGKGPAKRKPSDGFEGELNSIHLQLHQNVL